MTNIYASKKDFKSREPGQAPMPGSLLAGSISDAFGRLQGRLELTDIEMEILLNLWDFSGLKNGTNIPTPAQMRLAGVERVFAQKAPEEWVRAVQLRSYISEAPPLAKLREEETSRKREGTIQEGEDKEALKTEVFTALRKMIEHHGLAGGAIAKLLGIGLSSAEALKTGRNFPYQAIFRNPKGVDRLRALEGYALWGAPIERLIKLTGGKEMWRPFAPSVVKEEPVAEGPSPSVKLIPLSDEENDEEEGAPIDDAFLKKLLPVEAEGAGEEERRVPSVFLSLIKKNFPRPYVELPSFAVADLLKKPGDKWEALANRFPRAWKKSAAEIYASAERLSQKTGVDVARQVVLRESWIACAAVFVREMRQAYCSFFAYSPLDKGSRLGEEERLAIEQASLDVPLPVYRQAVDEVCAAYRLSVEAPSNTQEAYARDLTKAYGKIVLQAPDL